MKKQNKIKIAAYIMTVSFCLALGWIPNFAYHLGLGAKDFEPDIGTIIFLSIFTIVGLAWAMFYADNNVSE